MGAIPSKRPTYKLETGREVYKEAIDSLHHDIKKQFMDGAKYRQQVDSDKQYLLTMPPVMYDYQKCIDDHEVIDRKYDKRMKDSRPCHKVYEYVDMDSAYYYYHACNYETEVIEMRHHEECFNKFINK
jgi:hypothetical protein